MKWGVLQYVAISAIAVGFGVAPLAFERADEVVTSSDQLMLATQVNVRIVDGDTLSLSGERIRLHGIDAPELAQTCPDAHGGTWSCGAWSKAVLARLASEGVECAEMDVDRYGRVVAVCFADGVDLNAAMVARGAAYAYVKYSSDYLQQQQLARQTSAGLWRSGAQVPSEYRAQERAGLTPVTQAKTTSAPNGCEIKGNISGSGYVYHLPNSQWYARTRINEQKGERWFCSEQEARAAGWRLARG